MEWLARLRRESFRAACAFACVLRREGAALRNEAVRVFLIGRLQGAANQPLRPSRSLNYFNFFRISKPGRFVVRRYASGLKPLTVIYSRFLLPKSNFRL